MTNILQKIVNSKQVEILAAQAVCSNSEMRERARAAPEPRGFLAAICGALANGNAAVIAEVKKASPSKGILRIDFDPITIAQSYENGGATCLSVLTDNQFFMGSASILIAARAACKIPVLRKDFIIDEYQVWESRAMGADCILLIASILSDNQMQRFEKLAIDLGMAVLVETHDGAELERALALETSLIGINNRNLATFEVSLDISLTLSKDVPSSRVIVTESGISTKVDVGRMRANGINAFLVGEAFMRAADPGAALHELFR
jgi:indole-3-glycerol phosphate synthase